MEQAKVNQVKKQAKKANPVDLNTYNRYMELKFLESAGVKLKEEIKQEIIKLEKEIKNCSGKKSIRTRTAAIDNEIVKLIEGIPVPLEVQEIIEKSDKPEFYFGKV